MIKCAPLVVVVLTVLARLASAQDFAQIPVRSTVLTERATLVQGAGGNVLACAGPGGLLVVDCDYAEMSEKLLASLADLGAGPVRLVVNTHWHFDHVGGNAALAGAGAVILGHESLRRHMSAAQHLDVIDTDVPASPAGALPVVTVTDSLVLHWGEEEILVRHVPAAHTDGDLVVRLRRADILHAGDLFFNAGYPYIDTAHGGTIDGLLAGLDVILEMCGPHTQVVPGHGPPATPQELRGYREALGRFRDLVVVELQAGRTLAEIQAAKPTAELDAVWGRTMFPPDLFTEMVVRSF